GEPGTRVSVSPPASLARRTSRVSAGIMRSARRQGGSRPARATASAPPRPLARVGRQLADQELLVGGVAPHARDEIGIRRHERQVEQLWLGLLLGVDPRLFVALVGRGLLERLHGPAGQKLLV